MPKPIPTSFAREAFFSDSAIKFTNGRKVSRFGRYRIRPEAGTEYLTADEAARKSPHFLFDEFSQRIARGPIKFGVFVQLAEANDQVADATAIWPDDRTELELGSITLETRVNELEPEMRKSSSIPFREWRVWKPVTIRSGNCGQMPIWRAADAAGVPTRPGIE